MHPILFHIPLPKTQIAALYFYLAVAALGLIYAAAQWFVWKSKSNALFGVVIAALAIAAKFAGVLERFLVDKDATPDMPAGMIPLAPIPIYSYGVMLGLSLVVGWYLTLTLAERDGLPKETMANNYVVTAIAAIAGSRILYVLTNLNEFDSIMDIFALRRGGLVAYGGFLGGFLGSLFYLRRYRIPLLPWADVAVPSLASGLMITRIGCYMFGCDFGAVLAENDPPWLKKLGTFPKWAPGLLHEGNPSEGSPAWAQHVKQKLIDSSAPTSLPVHPTQIYESLVGLGLLVLLLTARRKQKFRGEIFLLFTFAYGVCRYLLEILRDDAERGSLPFSSGKHIMIPLGLAIFAAGFAIGFSNVIKNTVTLRLAQVLSFVPAVVAYFAMAPASFGSSDPYQWSTSQFVALTTGFAACVAFSVLYKAALAHPEQAMRIVLPLFDKEGREIGSADADEDDDADADEEDEPKKPVKKAAPAKKPAAEDKPATSAKKPVAKKKPAAKKPEPKQADADDEEEPAKDAKKADADDDEKPAKKADADDDKSDAEAADKPKDDEDT
ncbi:MAG: prolipoprotein diacylglyceryl transferase family protein [Polyangiaceae bacterium]